MKMPAIGLGTFRLQGQTVIDSVLAGLELGYRHIDTAQIYGNETEIGLALRQSGLAREALFVTTKIWTANLAASALLDSLQASRDALGLERLDLTLIHWPSPGDEISVAESMEALALAQQRGLTRMIGVSNFPISHLRQALDVVGAGAIANQQIEIHPFLQNRKVRAFCQQMAIPVTAYMPLAYGKVMQDPVMQALADKHACSPARVALAWLLEQGYTVIPSSTRRENLEANLMAADLHLDDDDRVAIAALDRNERLASPDFAPAWD
ncbi:2,5-didehydrogluconate reductase DkgB [Paludibacterium yongneupense]|uniref:2,5-didehydrogluconate reductase DkgB n=1 Tax=Paludibacterium yongneupense TaxID=400061 RepID=UPI0003FEB646|nr:2,5-didehydrogluconate reductase DkgB [Paludibacterium yongneupense]